MKLLRQLFHRKAVELELDEELRFHLARETQSNIAKGMSPDEARRQARLSFGGVEQTKEECRDQRSTRWLESIFQDVRYGLRTLRNNPSFTAVAVVTLALGIGANTAIFSLVYATLVKPLPYAEPSRLITIRGGQSLPDTLDIGRESQTIERIGVFADWPLDMLGGSKPEQVISAIVGGDVFPALGVDPQQGRYFTLEDNVKRRPVAVISDGFWHRYLGAHPDVLGRKLTLSGSVYTIIGVMPKNFVMPRGESELWIPFTVGYPEAVNARGAHFAFAVGKLRSGIGLPQAQTEVNLIGAELAKQYPEEARTFTLTSLRERMVAAVRTPLLVLFGAVSLVLLIACVNFSSLLITRTAARNREFQIRLSLGASRWRVLRQILTESIVIAFIGALTGTGLAALGTQLLMVLKPKDITGLDGSVFSIATLIFTIAVAVISGALFGLAPALQLVSTNASFRTNAHTSTARTRVRSFMVVAECAMALVLLTGSGLLIRSFWKLLNIDPGFNPQQLLTARLTLPAKKYNDIPSQLTFLTRLDRELHNIPGVEAAGIISELPMSGNHMEHNLLIKGRPEPPKGREPEISAHEASPNYFVAMQISLLSGRFFTEQDTATSEPVGIISQRMAQQFWPNESPLGQQVRWARASQEQWITIVGVVGDIRHDGLDDDAYPTIYTPLAQKQMAWKRFNSLVIRTRSSDPMTSAEPLQQAVWKTDPELPITFLQPMTAVMSESVAGRRFNMVLLSLFAGLALVLAIVGLYGVTSYLVTQRTQEIGIRMALGARPVAMLRMFISEGIMLSALGAIVGAVGAFWVLRLAQGMLFQVGTSDPVAFTFAAAVLILVAAAASYIPARRAARVDPMRALRLD